MILGSNLWGFDQVYLDIRVNLVHHQCRDVVVMDSDDEFEDANDDVMDDEDIFGTGAGAR